MRRASSTWWRCWRCRPAFGLWWGLFTSLASALPFNFFFLPPAHTLVIRSSSDLAALAAFALTALVTSNLSSRASRERDEASNGRPRRG